MTSSTHKFQIQRRSSAHSAYWMTNALVPAGMILIYKNGLSLEGFLGLVFIGIGASGYAIYKHKMRIPLLLHDGTTLTYRPSAYEPSFVTMDESATFTVQDLKVSVSVANDENQKFDVSRLDFDSNEDWDKFVGYLKNEKAIRLLFSN